jgi:peptidoglycan/LPS O-acetylase OafA/YrhL
MRPRLPLLDSLRILASVAIVRNHVAGDTLFGVGFGMPLFLVMMFALASSSTSKESLGSFARRKTTYLLTPWLRWSLLFMVVFAVRDMMWGQSPLARFTPYTIFSGGHPYYWFLPFAAVAIIAVRWLRQRIGHLPPGTIVVWFGISGALLSPGMARILSTGEILQPYSGWLASLPGIFYGVALGQALRIPTLRSRCLWLGLLCALSMGSAILFAGYPGLENVPRRYSVAVPLVCLGFAWRPRVPRLVPLLATTSFGIYLVHPLTILALRKVVDPSTWPPAAHVAVVWIASSAMIFALRWWRPNWSETGRLPQATAVSLPESWIERRSGVDA